MVMPTIEQENAPFSASMFKNAFQQPDDSGGNWNEHADRIWLNPGYLVLYGPTTTPTFSPLRIGRHSV